MTNTTDEFSDVVPVPDNRDLLEVSLMEYIAMPAGQQQYLKGRSITTTDIKTLGQLKRRIAEYIHLRSLEMKPQRLATVNRRFSRLAKQHGTSTMEVVNDLLLSERLITIERNGVSALFSGAVRREQVKELTALHMDTMAPLDIMMENLE
jgi:hypothetical protein